MGVSISIHREDDSYWEHPWNVVGLAGDKEFARDWTIDLPRIYLDDDRQYFRPTDINQWRAALPADRDNPDRFPEMFDILEREPDTWVRISW